MAEPLQSALHQSRRNAELPLSQLQKIYGVVSPWAVSAACFFKVPCYDEVK
jgi:hypothetical protein